MEPEHGVERLIGNNYILALGIDGDSACILQEQIRPSDRQPRWHISIIEDAPNAHVILQCEPSFNVVPVRTARISGTDNSKEHTVCRIGCHQPGVLRPRTRDGAEWFRISVGHAVKDSNSGRVTRAVRASLASSSIRSDQQVVEGVDSHATRAHSSVRSLQNPDRSHIAISVPRIDQNSITRGTNISPCTPSTATACGLSSCVLGPKILRSGETSPLASPRKVRIAKAKNEGTRISSRTES